MSVKPKLGGVLAQISQITFALLEFIIGSTKLFKGDMILQEEVNRPGNVVSGGDQGLAGAKLSPLAAIECAEGRATAGDRGGCLTKGLTSAIGGGQGARAKDCAAGNIMMRGQAEPGGNGLGGRPAVQVRPISLKMV